MNIESIHMGMHALIFVKTSIP